MIDDTKYLELIQSLQVLCAAMDAEDCSTLQRQRPGTVLAPMN